MPKDFKSFSQRVNFRSFRAGFRSFRLSQKLHKIRLFRSKSLAGRAFFSGFKSTFPRFWREIGEDRRKSREKAIQNYIHRRKDFKPTKSIFEVYQMKNLPIDWDSVPDVMNKDQFYRLCHISKSTALHLLKSGKVPCEWSGKVVQKE